MRQKSDEEVLKDIKRLNLVVEKRKRPAAPIAGKGSTEKRREAERGPGREPARETALPSNGSAGASSGASSRGRGMALATVSPETRRQGPRRRLEDTVPPISGQIGRRIVRYAWANRFGVFSFLDLLRSFSTIWNRRLDFNLNRRFLTSLLCGSGRQTGSVSAFSLSDTFEELSWISGRLLGSWDSRYGAAIVREIDRAAGCSAVRYLGSFLSVDPAVLTDQAYLRQRFLEGDKIPVRSLAWAVRGTWRLSLMTEGISRKTVQRILEQALAVNTRAIEEKFDGLASQKRALTEELSLYPPLFLRLLDNLRRFKRELYPPLLFLLGEFYPFEDRSREKGERILLFCGISDQELLTPERLRPAAELTAAVGAGAMGTAERTEGKATGGEAGLESDGAQVLEDLEAPAEENDAASGEGRNAEGDAAAGAEAEDTQGDSFEPAAEKAEKTGEEPLALLERILPGSTVSKLGREFLLPWFSSFFEPDNPFPQEIRYVHHRDPLAVLFILHRLTYGLFSCVNAVALENYTGDPEYRIRFIDLRSGWQLVERELFSPYLVELSAVAKSLSTHEDRALFRERHEHSVQWKIDAMRRHMVKYYRGASDGLSSELARKGIRIPRGFNGPKLYEIVEPAAAFAADILERIPQGPVPAEGGAWLSLRKRLAENPIVDLAPHMNRNSMEYLPIAFAIGSFLEKENGKPLSTVSVESHGLVFDLLSRLTSLYADLTASPDSPLVPEAPFAADEDTAIAWAREPASDRK
jgi:hypothetical protein